MIQPVLDQLPDIAIPDTIARVRVTPNERVETGTRLIQRALHAEISIAGQRLFDVVAGEAVGRPRPTSAAAAWPTLRCSARSPAGADRRLRAGRTRAAVGAADRRYVGRRVRIRFMADRRTVARRRCAATARQATAPLPPASIRTTNRARYEARIGKQRSMRLKLVRRMG